MPDMHVRRAVVRDLDDLVESVSALFVEDALAWDALRAPGWPEVGAASWCAGILADPAALVLVAVDSDRVVGHLVGMLIPASAMWTAPRAELMSARVAPDRRRQGVGGRLAAEFAAWARAVGAFRLVVSAYSANTDAVRFYRSLGYRPTSTELALEL